MIDGFFPAAFLMIGLLQIIEQKNLRFENIRPNLCEFLLLVSTLPFLFSILLFHLFLQPQSKKEIVSSPRPVQATTSSVLLILPVLLPSLIFSVTLPLFHPSPWAIKHTQVSLISVTVRAFSKPTVLSLPFLPYQSPRTTFFSSPFASWLFLHLSNCFLPGDFLGDKPKTCFSLSA